MSTALQESAESAAFLQRRVVVFAGVMTALSTGALAFQLLYDLTTGHPERLTTGLYASYLLGAAPMLALLAYCRTQPRPPDALRRAEALAVTASIVALAVAGRYLNTALLPEFTTGVPLELVYGPLHRLFCAFVEHYVSISIALAATQMMVLRAALIPSRLPHSIALTATAGLVVCVVSGLGIIPFQADQAVREATTWQDKTVVTSLLLFWWAMTTVICGVISHVIYSLRQEVRAAKQLGQYVLGEKLGAGGMGVVYRASHAMMRRPTAIKLLPPELSNEASIARFEREVQLTARLTHPNTITIFDYGRTADGVFYYAMELLEGASLQEVVDRTGPMPIARVLRIMRTAAGALAEAHDAGLVHRDIKPANIFLCERGGEHDVAKVLDFGLVKDLAANETSLTQAGTVTGTPLYMAPEAIKSSEDVDGRADLYALGAVAYFALTGQHVFRGRTVLEVCAMHLTASPEPPSQRMGQPIDPAFEQILLQCLEKEPDNRPRSARDLISHLDAVNTGSPWTQDKAKAWWEENGRALSDHVQDTATTGIASTIAVAPIRTSLGRGMG